MKYPNRRYTFTMQGSTSPGNHEVHEVSSVAELLRSLADLIEVGAIAEGEEFKVRRIEDTPV